MAEANKSDTNLENESIQNLLSDMVNKVDTVDLAAKESKSAEEVKPAEGMLIDKMESNIISPKSATNISTRPDQTHPLQFRWVLWYLHADNSKKAYSWEDSLKKIAVFSTVEEFWAIFNHLAEPSCLLRGCDYYLFKEGIKPMWEDSANIHGGRWLLFVDRKAKKLDDYWIDLLLAIVGEQFDDYGNDICGIVVNARSKADKLSVWTVDANLDDVNMGIGKIFKEKLSIPDTEVIQYESHKDASHRQNSGVKARLVLPQKDGNHVIHYSAKDKEKDYVTKAGIPSNSSRTEKNEKYGGRREWRNSRLQRIDSK